MGFASKTLTEHVVRGVVGFAGLAIALTIMKDHPWAAVTLMPVVLWMFRGCPICWTTGLIETLAMKVLARSEDVPRAIERERAEAHLR